jgi:hypothetical protein
MQVLPLRKKPELKDGTAEGGKEEGAKDAADDPPEAASTWESK